MNTLTTLLPLLVLLELVLAWTDDKSDPSICHVKSRSRTLEQETDAKGRPFTIHKLPIPALHQVVTKEDLPGYIYEEGEEERVRR